MTLRNWIRREAHAASAPDAKIELRELKLDEIVGAELLSASAAWEMEIRLPGGIALGRGAPNTGRAGPPDRGGSAMLTTRVFLAVQPVDLRASFDRLYGYVSEVPFPRRGGPRSRPERVDPEELDSKLDAKALSHKYAFMRTTLDLPDALFRELKAQSALQGVKLKDLVAELLQTGLARQKASARTRSPLPVIRPASGRKHPALTNRELEELLTAEDAHGRD